MAQIVKIPLPKNWPVPIKSSILHTISLALTVFSPSKLDGWQHLDRLKSASIFNYY